MSITHGVDHHVLHKLPHQKGHFYIFLLGFHGLKHTQIIPNHGCRPPAWFAALLGDSFRRNDALYIHSTKVCSQLRRVLTSQHAIHGSKMLRCVGFFSFYTLVSGIKGDNICTFTEKMSPRTRMHLYRVPYYNNLHTLQTPASTRHAPDSQRNILHRRQKNMSPRPKTSKNSMNWWNSCGFF